MGKWSRRIILFIAFTAVGMAVVLMAAVCAFAGEPAQPIVELQNNSATSTSFGSEFPGQAIAATDSATKQAYKFQRQREGTNFSYQVANLWPNTAYTVELSFVEHDVSSVGQRSFNVYLQGGKVISNLDVYLAAGGKNRAYQRLYGANSTADGTILVGFRSDEAGGKDSATISTVRVYRGGSDVVEIDAAASRIHMSQPIRHTNTSQQNTFEALLGRLGSRFSLDLAPQRLSSQFTTLGTGTGDLSDFVLALKHDTTVRALPFTDRYAEWELIQQSQTMTSQTYVCASSFMPFQLIITFRAPFYPGNEKVSGAPFVYVDVSVRNVGPSTDSAQFVFARPHKRTFASSLVTSFSTATEVGITYDTSYTYGEETQTATAQKSAVEALAVPAGEAGDVTFKGSAQVDFEDFSGSTIWGWNSPSGYPKQYNDPKSPILSFYPRGYSGAVWDTGNIASGAYANKHFIMAGYSSASVLYAKNTGYEDSYKFRYTTQFANVGAVVNYAVSSRSAGDLIQDKSAFFDSTMSSDSYLLIDPSYAGDVRSLTAYAFQSFLINTWWCQSATREWFSVWEGTSCRFHSTVDVEYNEAWVYFEYWPDLLRKIMNEWVLYKKGNAQGIYLSHDMGAADQATGQAYSHDMPVEENANFILLLYKYWKTTGDTAFVNQNFPTVRQFVDFMINCDTNNNGLPDLNTANTVDQGSTAIQSSRDQTYLGVKCQGAYIAAREMAAALSVPDATYQAKCQGQAELINQTLKQDLWLSDHYAVCLDANVDSNDRDAYSIYATNGLVYPLAGNRSPLVTASNIANMRTDLVNATNETLKEYGCTHSSYDSYNEWVSQNQWRDIAAGRLSVSLNGANPLALSSRYWSAERYFALNANGGFWDVVIYPGGSGPTGDSVRSAAGGYGREPAIQTVGEGGAAGGAYGQSLGYYPRGITGLGLVESAAGVILDTPGNALYYQPTAYPLRVPVLSRADWDNADPSKRIPTLYFPNASSAATVTNANLLPAKVAKLQVAEFTDVSAGQHAISPNGDGVNDTATVSYTVPVGSSVGRSVWEGSERSRDIGSVSQAAGAQSFQWDGKDNSGGVVGDGVYTARMDAAPTDTNYAVRPGSAEVYVNNSIPDLSTTWYLAEGYTGQNTTGGEFEEYVLIQNPNGASANIEVTFMLPGGQTEKKTYVVAANSRFTISVDAILSFTEVSTYVKSDQKIAVERAMYFNGRLAGHDATGVTQPGDTWYLAEGYTAEGFDEFVLIQNPGDTDANVTALFTTSGTEQVTKKYKVGKHSRFTIHVDDFLPASEVSTMISSDQPVVVERAQYLNEMKSGTDSIAARSVSRTWFLAEGYTAEGFETWVLIQNPQDTANEITVTFMDNSGNQTIRNYTLEPNSRFTIPVDQIWEASEVSVKVRAESPVLVERSMYWNERSDGHACIGTPTPDTVWYLPEGYTAEGFETWILVSNPGDTAANVTFTFMEPSGRNTEKTYTVEPRRRFTLGVDSILPSAEVSTRVAADRFIIVERSIYFNGRSGGTGSLGVRGD